MLMLRPVVHPGGVNESRISCSPAGTGTPSTSALVRATGTCLPSTVAVQPSIHAYEVTNSDGRSAVTDQVPCPPSSMRPLFTVPERPGALIVANGDVSSTVLVSMYANSVSGVLGLLMPLRALSRPAGCAKPTRYDSSRRGVYSQRV